MHVVVSYYALTDDLRRFLENDGPAPIRYVSAGMLRNLGIWDLLRQIRGLKAEQITVAIENDNATPLAGPLLILGALSGTRRIRIMWPDRRAELVPFSHLLGLVARIGWAQLRSRSALFRARRSLSGLEGAPPPVPTARKSRHAILYLDANLSFGFSAGGSAGHIRGVIEGLCNAGFDVDYASIKAMTASSRKAHWLRIDPPSLYAFPPELNYYPFNAQYEGRLERAAREKTYDFLYQRMSLHNFSGAVLRRRLGLPLVLEYNGSEAWTAANWGERLRLHDDAVAAERASLRAADLVVTVSKVLGEEIAAAGVPRERIVVYPNCINPAIFDPGRFSTADNRALRQRLGIAPDARVATFIGTFGTWHGIDFLAHAVRRLVAEQRDWLEATKLHFLLIGDGLKMPQVRQAIAGEPFERFVSLPGLVPQADAPAYLAASDIFLSPHIPNPDGSAFFGSPTKLFEYMAMGRPIVASDLDQIGAVLKGTYLDDAPAPEGPLAELFTPGDEDAFLAAFRKVVDHPDEARRMGGRARAVALRFYTWDRHVGEILARMRALRLIGSEEERAGEPGIRSAAPL